MDATRDNEVLLEVSNVTRSFSLGAEKVEILHGINLKIYAGEMVAIIGQSGSGKSTLMNFVLFVLYGADSDLTKRMK